MGDITKIGVIGCGSISNNYFIAAKAFKFMKLAYCADLRKSREIWLQGGYC